MNTYTQKREQAQAKLERELAEIAVCEEAERLLPGNPVKVHPHSAYAKACAEYEAESIDAAIQFLETLCPLVIYKVERGTLALTPNPGEKGEIEPLGLWYLLVKSFRYQGTRTDWILHAFLKLEGNTYEIRINVDKDAMREAGYRMTYSYEPPSKDYPEGTAQDCRVTFPRDYFNQTIRYWATDGQPNDFVLY